MHASYAIRVSPFPIALFESHALNFYLQHPVVVATESEACPGSSTVALVAFFDVLPRPTSSQRSRGVNSCLLKDTPYSPPLHPTPPRCRRWSGSPSDPAAPTRASSTTRPPSRPLGEMAGLSTWRLFWGAPTTRCRWCSHRCRCARPYLRYLLAETQVGGGRGVARSARLGARNGWAA